MMTQPVRVADFGRDHWSLLAYVETTVVDGGQRVEDAASAVGTLAPIRLRSNPARHPWAYNVVYWKDEYSTRLAGHSTERPHQIKGHDDWDCLDDLEEAGLVDIWSITNGLVSLTAWGIEVAAALRAHKATGGNFAEFSLPAAV